MRRITLRLNDFAHAPPYQTTDTFTPLFEHTHRVVFRYIWAVGGSVLSRQDVEDLTGETFLRAWRSRTRFHGDEDAAVGWLLQIARRLVVDAYRRRKRRPIASTAFEDLGSRLPPSDTLPEDEILQSERQRSLWLSVASLPDQHREMIALRYVVGWQVKQIALHLDMNENTVSAALRRIIASLAKTLDERDANAR